MRPSEDGSPALTCPAGDIEAPKAIVLRVLDELAFGGVRVASLAASDDCLTRSRVVIRR
jgi:hypothetical protein